MRFSKAILLVLLLANSGSIMAKELVLAADPWCPYNCNPNSGSPGYLIELTQKLLEPHGYKVRYINLPWKRAVLAARTGLVDGIIGAGKDEVPDFIFPEKPFFKVKHSFFSREDSNWFYTGHESLESMRIGVIKDYSYGSFRAEYILGREEDRSRLLTVYSEKGISQLTRLLDAGRIDILIEAEGVFKHYVSKSGLTQKYRLAGVASVENIYISLSPAKSNSKEVAELLALSFQAFEGTPEHQKLLEKYIVGMWPPQ